MDQEESRILEALELAVRSEAIRPKIEAIVARVEQKLRESPDDVFGLGADPPRLLHGSSPRYHPVELMFILRANTITGAERHPNSHQRMMSHRGFGDFQTRPDGDWCSHLLTSDQTAPIAERRISIPPNVWRQGVVPGQNWVVVSFQTVAEHELIEERPVREGTDAVRQRKYAGAPTTD